MSKAQSALDRNDSMPLYIQLKNIIREKISTGEWAPNHMIPSENELSRIYGISRMTVRNVITQFVTQGFLYRIQGKGTFVSESKYEITSTHYVGIREQLERQGHEVKTHLVSCTKAYADNFLSKKMNLVPGEEIFKIKRIRSANGINISYHKSFIPVSLCPNLNEKDLQNRQLCEIMSAEYSFYRGRMIETMESYIADNTKAGYLDVYPGFPLILLQNQLYSTDNIIYEYTRVYFRGDKVKIRIEHNSIT